MIIFLIALTNEDEALINELFTLHNQQLFRVSMSILHSSDNAEEAVQEAFLKIINNIEKIHKIPCHERLPFCVVIVKNISISMCRSQKKTISVNFAAEMEDLADEELVDDIVLRKSDTEKLLNMLNLLPTEDKILLQLRWGEEMPYNNIAELLNIPPATARKRASRALLKLKELFGEDYINDREEISNFSRAT